ncbi:MAG: chemotaxis protein CheR [Paenibacillus sp.]|nr:chemotaxis protein CheR [Paenibacillus sp.]
MNRSNNLAIGYEGKLGNDKLEKVEIGLLIEALYQYYGHDFRGYSFSSIRRRIWHRVYEEKLTRISALTDQILHDPSCMNRLIRDFSINVTEMFRDPSFFLAFRRKAVPLLRTYPVIRIWIAGCSTGEEAYSTAILLHEEGLYKKCRIYATDMNEDVLKRARSGVFPLQHMRDYTQNYLRSGGTSEFSGYYRWNEDSVQFHPDLMENIVFAKHNLATDRSFNEFNAIFCRNVLIYFDKALQNHVHDLFYESLSIFGVLGLGIKESITFTKNSASYDILDASEKLYRKCK